MILVDFILIGAQKSGTTSLAYQLSQHPQIGFCQNKEPNYFSRSGTITRNEDEYHGLYEQGLDKVYGEASTNYSWFPQYPDTAQKVYDYNPNMKLIYIMRNPVERIRSHYTHRLLRARTRLPADQEVFGNPIYVNRSRYSVQLQLYLALFPRKNIYLIVFEEYITNSIQTLHNLADFLGIDRKGFNDIDLVPQYKFSSRTGDKKIKRWLTPMSRLFPLKIRNALRGSFVYTLEQEVQFSKETRQMLWALVSQDVLAIENILGRKLPSWWEKP